MKKYTLYGILILVMVFSVSFEIVDAKTKLDYSFPDYVSVNKKIYRANWRKKSGDTYKNVSGAENVTENELTDLTYDNIALSCVSFKGNIQAQQIRGKYVAVDENGNRVADYCEEGYSVSFDQALGSGNMVQEDGVWKLRMCEFYTNGLQDAIDSIVDPANITMTPVAGGKYQITFKVMQQNPNTFVMRFLNSDTYTDDNGKIQYAFDHSGNPGSYTTYTSPSIVLDAGREFFIEFYVNGSSDFCSEEFVAQLKSGVPKYIPNPVLDYAYENGTKVCDTLKNKYGDDGVATGMVPHCFRATLNYDETIPSRNEIIQAVATVDGMLNGKTSISKSSNTPTQKCNYLRNGGDGTSTTTGTENGISAGNVYRTSITNKYLSSSLRYTYWRAECSEEMTVMYDDPKAVNAGGGFSYTTMITITRTCTPVQIKTPRLKPLCEYSADCMGKGHTGGPGAGPNEDFDQCMNTCDGGKYTQSCIDSCYDSVYGETKAKTLSLTDGSDLGLLSYQDKTGVVPVMTGSIRKDCSLLGTTIKTPRPVSSCYVIGGNGGCKKKKHDDSCPTCITEHNVDVWYCDGCNGTSATSSNGVQCYEVWASTSDCSLNPEKDYQEEVKTARSEYESLIASIREYTNNDYKDEEIYTGVYDNYLDKQVNFGKNQQPLTDVTVTSSTSGDRQAMIAQTLQNGNYPVTQDMLSYTWRQYTTTRTQTVHLTQAYVSNTTNQQLGIGTIYQKNTMNCERDDKNDDLCTKYYNGGYKYYTNLLAPTVNDYRNWPYFNPNNADYTIKTFTTKGNKYENIDVDLRNFGSWNQWDLDIDCVYGLYQNYMLDKDPSDCDPNKDICSSGVQYIYREIELEDNFPNERDPRWNWSGTIGATSIDGRRLVTGAARYGTASYRGYNVDPLALINHIEGNGNTIYDVQKDSSEVDYEFVLTRKNLRNIRSYNKSVQDFNRDGYNNYADYDTSCYTKRVNGQDIQICTNNFLDDDRYVTYSTSGYTVASRKKIAECNNAKNQECYDISSKN